MFSFFRHVPPPRPRLPAERRFSSSRLPLRRVSAVGRPLQPVEQAPDHYDTGPRTAPFDFTKHIRAVCEDITSKCSLLHHINPDRLLFDFTQSRKGTRWGLQARVTPMRFEEGQSTRIKRKRLYQVQRYFVDECEMLYIVTFCLPRFLNRDFADKLITIFHELYHIGPRFDGDLRRHPGRCHVHTHSQKEYDAGMADLAREYLQNGADQRCLAFLRLNYHQLVNRHQSVVGVVVPRPKLIAVA